MKTGQGLRTRSATTVITRSASVSWMKTAGYEDRNGYILYTESTKLRNAQRGGPASRTSRKLR